MTFDVRTWALHDAVFQLARDSGLDSFRVECKQGAEGETVIALVLGHGPQRTPATNDGAVTAKTAGVGRTTGLTESRKKGG